jgi:putative addiction module component (TIGR02574 family)
MQNSTLLDQLLVLPSEERLTIAEALWDSVAAEPGSAPIPDWHREILDQRLAEDDADESHGESWADVRSRIEMRR